jgi:hypothetical protein
LYQVDTRFCVQPRTSTALKENTQTATESNSVKSFAASCHLWRLRTFAWSQVAMKSGHLDEKVLQFRATQMQFMQQETSFSDATITSTDNGALIDFEFWNSV